MYPTETDAILSRSCLLLQLKLEDRSVVPRDVVRHMRSTVSPASHPWQRVPGVTWARSPVVAGATCLLGPGCLLLPRTVSAAP